MSNDATTDVFQKLIDDREAILDRFLARTGRGREWGVSIGDLHRLAATPDERLAWAQKAAAHVYGLDENAAFNLVRNVVSAFGLLGGPHPGTWTDAAALLVAAHGSEA